MEEICTQPLDSQTIPIDQLINESAPSYGQLVGNGYNFGTIELCSEKFSVGRDQKCDLVVSEELLPHSSRILISNFHFTLERDVKDCYSPTYIIDSSTNGTFVNGILIGRNNRAILLPGFIISIAAFRNLFVYKQPNYSLPPEVESPGLIKQYHIGRVIGSGSFGTVHLLHHVSSCVPYALKIVRKQPYKMKLRGSSSLFNETEIMKKLNHPCVIRMFDFINDPSSISIVLEYMQGGDLLTRIMDNSYLPEQTAKFYFYQLCHAIHYLHSRGIIHRDLKPDNILLKDAAEHTLLKVSDFGSSKFLDNTTFMRTICGTPEYVAPEILEPGRTAYTSKVDVWSLGVVLYTMLSGLLPFGRMNGMTDAELVTQGIFTMSQPVWRTVKSCRPKMLIYHILNVNPDERPSIEMLLENEWFNHSDVVQLARSLMKLS